MPDEDLAQLLGDCLARGGRNYWERFIESAQPLIAATVLHTLARFSAGSRNLADDLVQETFLRLCDDNFRALRSFRGAGDAVALKAYLRVIASNTVIGRLRRDKNRTVDLEAIAGTLASVDVTHEHLEKTALIKAIEKCLASETARDYRIFWLRHRDGLLPKEIAAIPDIGLATGGVENVIYKTTVRVMDCVHRAGLLPSKAPPGITANERVTPEGGRP
jgi:RNA polymerase sigma-70 factor (ECF subfamily)